MRETRGFAAVCHELGTGGEAGLVGGQKQDEVGKLDRLTHPVQCHVVLRRWDVFGHRCADHAGVNRVDANVVLAEVERCALGETSHSELRRCVAGKCFVALQAGRRRDVDDRAFTALLEWFDDGFGSEEHTREVDADDRVPVFERVGLDRPEVGNAGVVDEDVEAAKRVYRGCNGSLPLGVVGDVEMNVVSGVTEFFG